MLAFVHAELRANLTTRWPQTRLTYSSITNRNYIMIEMMNSRDLGAIRELGAFDPQWHVSSAPQPQPYKTIMVVNEFKKNCPLAICIVCTYIVASRTEFVFYISYCV